MDTIKIHLRVEFTQVNFVHFAPCLLVGIEDKQGLFN
jgi:hypothetical protein